MSPQGSPALEQLTIRQARPDDAEVCGRICYSAFSTINASHGFPCDFPDAASPVRTLTRMFSSPGHYCVVAEIDGRIVGSNCMDERAIIMGIGPITVDPEAQNSGAGRKLMQAVMDRATERGAGGVRLVQAAFHNRSLSLYSSLGFDVREPLACMQGTPPKLSVPGCDVRPATPADSEACNALSRRIQGFDRGMDLASAIEQGTAKIVERGGRITGYATMLAFWGHAAAETNPDLQALIAAADSFGGPGILVPSRNAGLFRWCLANGMRVVQPMTLMSIGLYNDPAGAWLPSILF
jgi:predicted N-acetyltransferase YhbS